MKLFKLWIHQKNFSDEELVLNPKDFPDLKVGDVVEIYHPEDNYSRLLLQVKSFREDFQHKEVVSINAHVAGQFQLRHYQDVVVEIVDRKNVSLDLVELIVRDHYMSRSDMWRMTKNMVNTCLYLNKKVEDVGIRVQVHGLWAKGENYASGYVSEDTRVVYRSPTAVVHIFIQMSSEMWEFDLYGDLYFEKAVSGFLKDLFDKWSKENCLHDVTIVMFSRSYYEAQSVDDFPPSMRECLQKDNRGRFYEDFYRIVVQNERYDDWTKTMIQLKTLFIQYPKLVLEYHDYPGQKIPKATNSTAAQGNFLEVINMSLNVYEKYYIDRNFDRVGKSSIVITPGAGVFEVDRELTTVTKQRTIDSGIGSDLVCMGEQPLHAVPLLRFHSKTIHNGLDVGDDYNIPHWINHSFYTSRSQVQISSKSSFVPRIKLASKVPVNDKENNAAGLIRNSMMEEDTNLPFIDYDEYDRQVFKLPSTKMTLKSARGKYRSSTIQSYALAKGMPTTFEEAKRKCQPRKRCVSDEFVALLDTDKHNQNRKSSAAIGIPGKTNSADYMSCSLGTLPIQEVSSTSHQSLESTESEDAHHLRLNVVGSAGSPVGHHLPQSLQLSQRPRRALVNPFAPSRVRFKMTSNRRRWVHAFPLDPLGTAILPHHYYDIDDRDTNKVDYASSPTREVIQAANLVVEARKQKTLQESFPGNDHSLVKRSKSPAQSSHSGSESGSTLSPGSGLHHVSSQTSIASEASAVSVINTYEQQDVPSQSMSSTPTRQSKYLGRIPSLSKEVGKELAGSMSWQWGPVTGEQEWSPTITTGVDWRSMSRPANLPITTDFFPDKMSLHRDYLISDYTLLPDDINSDIYERPQGTEEFRYDRKPLTTMQVFKELLYQRLGQGFQLIVLSKGSSPSSQTDLGTSPRYTPGGLIRARARNVQCEEYLLSIGRIYHKLNLTGPTITVTRYRPRHPYAQKNIHYRYRFNSPDSENYDVSWCTFSNNQLENYNWNYLDNYICTKGQGDYGLMDSLKYWRAKFLLLPCNNPATKKILEGAPRCDIYEEKTPEEKKQLTEGFTKFLGIVNKMKPPQSRRPVKMMSRRDSVNTDEPNKLRSAENTPVGSMSGSVQSPVDIRKSGQLISHSSTEIASVTMGYVDSNQGSTPSKSLEQMSDSVFQSSDSALSITSPMADIVKAMKHPDDGVSFIPSQQGLPSNCFYGMSATNWVMANVSGASTEEAAILFLQKMVDEKVICHASKSIQQPFVNGFFFFFFVTEKDKVLGESDPYSTSQYYRSQHFQDDWIEVAYHETTTKYKVPFLLPKLSILSDSPKSGVPWKTEHTWGGRVRSSSNLNMSPTFKHITIDIEAPKNSSYNRPEWAHVRFHGNYDPACAFEIQCNWLVATGTLLGEMVNGWARKAGYCGFHLLPVPIDSFALPYTRNSDPLRGPIYVPLKVECITEPGQVLFSGFDPESRTERINLLQEAILKRFGFMLDGFVNPVSPDFIDDSKPQYIHCSGGMCVMIPESSQVYVSESMKPEKQANQPNPGGIHRLFSPDKDKMHKDYVERQRSRADSLNQTTAAEIPYENKVGFLWSWNSMLTKRWRSSNTGDEAFQDKMLADFRAFCANQNNRLKIFWDSCVSELDNMTEE